MSDKIYESICSKLDFVPSELPDIRIATEDDRLKSPFSVLTPDEIRYLYENGYLRNDR